MVGLTPAHSGVLRSAGEMVRATPGLERSGETILLSAGVSDGICRPRTAWRQSGDSAGEIESSAQCLVLIIFRLQGQTSTCCLSDSSVETHLHNLQKWLITSRAAGRGLQHQSNQQFQSKYLMLSLSFCRPGLSLDRNSCRMSEGVSPQSPPLHLVMICRGATAGCGGLIQQN